MIKFSALLWLFLIVLPVKSQENGGDFSVFIGGEDVMPSSGYFPRIIGCDSGAIYSVNRDAFYHLERLSPQLEPEVEEEVDFFNRLRERELIKIVHFFDTIYLFTMEETFNYCYLYVETIDKETMKQNYDPRIIFRTRHIKGWKTEFGVLLSREEKKLLAYSQNILPWQKLQVLQFRVYGGGLDLNWEKSTSISYQHVFEHETNMVVDESGNVFMLYHYFEPVLPRLLDKRVNRYHLLSLTEHGNIVDNQEIFFEGKYIKDIRIHTFRNRDIACTGLWSGKRREELAEGVFYFRLNPRVGLFRDLRFHNFPADVVASFLEVKPEEKPQEMLGIQLMEFIPRSSGQYVAIAEQRFDQDYRAANNLLVYAIRPGGDIAWYEIIRKKQNRNTLNNQVYNSFALVAPVHKDWIGILYNDHLKNLDQNRKRMKAFSHRSRSYLNCVQINRNGNRREFTLYRKSGRRMPTPLPARYYDTKSDAIILHANHHRNYFLMWIRLENF